MQNLDIVKIFHISYKQYAPNQRIPRLSGRKKELVRPVMINAWPVRVSRIRSKQSDIATSALEDIPGHFHKRKMHSSTSDIVRLLYSKVIKNLLPFIW